MNKVTNIRGLDAKTEAMQTEILSQYPDLEGMNTKSLSHLVAERMTTEDIKNLTKLIDKIISKMAIVIKVTYDPKNKSFTLDFRIDNIDDKIYGKVVHIKLQDILFHQCTYRHNIESSIVATLIYTLAQKEVA